MEWYWDLFQNIYEWSPWSIKGSVSGLGAETGDNCFRTSEFLELALLLVIVGGRYGICDLESWEPWELRGGEFVAMEGEVAEVGGLGEFRARPRDFRGEFDWCDGCTLSTEPWVLEMDCRQERIRSEEG